MTPEDIKEINERVVDKKTQLPDDIRYATFYNRDRDSINAALFEKHCAEMQQTHGHTNDAVLVFSDNIQVKNGTKKFVPFRNCTHFWENCGEDNIKLARGRGRMDPVLRLYSNCRVMLPTNVDVASGQANGTQAIFQKLILKHGTTPATVTLSNGIEVKGVLASDVDHVILKHTNERVRPRLFSLKPKSHRFIAKILRPPSLQSKGDERENLAMKANQLPLIINDATTGHKLQGSGVDNLFVHSWSYVTNWAYVMLSRVKTKGGLYMRQPLSRDLKRYAVPPSLSRMLAKLRRHAPTYWTDDQYDEKFSD